MEKQDNKYPHFRCIYYLICCISRCNYFCFQKCSQIHVFSLSCSSSLFQWFTLFPTLFLRVGLYVVRYAYLDHHVPILRSPKRACQYAIMLMLVYWYSNQLICVRLRGGYSSSFRVTNGVRQGRILSGRVYSAFMLMT